MRRSPFLPALLTIGLSGCAASEAFLATPGEYGVYRKTRAATTLEERLTAAQQYLTAYPDGAHIAEVGSFFRSTEPLYFAHIRGRIDGLEAYLRALPKGPNAAQAALRLRDLRARDNAERTDLVGAAATTSASVEREIERRKSVRLRLRQWIGMFLDAAVFGAPLINAKAAVIVPWSLQLPWPVCERTDGGPDAPKGPAGAARRCTKLLQFDYSAVEDGEPQERQALVEIAIWQDEAGRPIEVAIGGPELFLRLDETETARGAVATDPEAHIRGAERAVEVARRAFAEEVSGDGTCVKASENDVLRLACKGVELRVRASALEGEDDRFVVRALR